MRRIAITNHDACHAEIYHFVKHANAAQSTITFKRIRLEPLEQQRFQGSPVDGGALLDVACEYARRGNLEGLVVLVDGNLQDDEDDEYFVMRSDPGSNGMSQAAVMSLWHLRLESTFMRDSGDWWKRLNESTRRRIASDSVLLLLLGSVTGMFGFAEHDESLGCVMDYCQSPTDLIAALKGGFTFCGQCREHLQQRPEGRAILEIALRLTQHPFRARPLARDEFDVFMSYHSSDREAVEHLVNELRQRGINAWFDHEQLRPGLQWTPELEQQIGKARSAAVCIGRGDQGPWQRQEIYALVNEFVNRQFPVIPVILPVVPGGTPPIVPIFLRTMTWVDLRADIPNPLDQLIWGITGERPRRP